MPRSPGEIEKNCPLARRALTSARFHLSLPLSLALSLYSSLFASRFLSREFRRDFDQNRASLQLFQPFVARYSQTVYFRRTQIAGARISWGGGAGATRGIVGGLAPIVKQLYNYRTAVINCRQFQRLPRRAARERRVRRGRLQVHERRGINSLTLHRETYLPVKLVGRRVRDYLLKQFPNVDRRRRRMT